MPRAWWDASHTGRLFGLRTASNWLMLLQRQTMSRSVRYRIIGAAVLAVGILVVLLFSLRKGVLRAEDILAAYDEESEYGQLTISYPLDETLFPPEIAAPTFRWEDSHAQSDAWLIALQFQDNEGSLNSLTRTAEWTPSDEQWEAIKHRSLEKDVRVTVIGVNHAAPGKILSSAGIAIRTSKDEVGAPVFYREVNLPFIEAIKDPSHIRWRFGEISSKAQPPIVLENLAVCGNCHSFSTDGRFLGMDVDYASDKGSYAITRVEEEIILAKSKIITWNDYKKDENEPTFGLLSQVSPDGRYVASTVKDRSIFVPRPSLDFSSLFFPLKGIIAVYRRDTGTFHALPGADDKEFVQSNPSWSPDGKYIVFVRNKAYVLKGNIGGKVLLSEEDCREFLEDGKTFLFDLYRIPFNDGEGGKAEPLEGASNNGMSNYFAKYSPDGKWIVFCKARTFMLLQPDSELYIIPAEGGEARRMRCNTPRMNSWHSWSPNGKWMIFASKPNGPYTQLFLTHIDEQGNDTPAVLLDRFTAPDRAANIPEFVNVRPGAIRKIHEQFVDDVSFVRAGIEFMRAYDYDRAVQAFHKALDLNPENVRALCKLGVSLAIQGKVAEAIPNYREAIRLKPDYAEAHNNLASALVMQGKIDEGIAHYTEAIGLNPLYVEAHASLGTALAMQGKLDQAVAHHSEAIRLSPDFGGAHYNLGLALAMQGKLDEAIEHYNEAIRLNPKDPDPHNDLGLALARQGKLDQAIGHFTQALRIRPDFAQARTNLDAALRQKEQRTGP